MTEIMNIEFNTEHLALARRAAAEGTVLLKNEHNTLPLSKNDSVALFGRNQFDTFKGGGGAADLWAVPVISFAEGLNEIGNVYQPLLTKYRKYSEANKNNTMNKIPRQYTWSLTEIPLAEEEVIKASQENDTAIIFIGRFSAEHFDIKDTAGQYRITDAEEAMLYLVTKHFKRSVLVFNLPGIMDISFLNKYSIDAVLNVFMPGMEAGHALADVIYGDVTPSGKLPDSWCETADHYPAKENFGLERVVYSEGIYMGYRYFDSFNKTVVYPFGYGLSYTSFSIDTKSVSIKATTVTVEIAVTNTGKYKGKETVQCYLSCPQGELDKPYQVLCGFQKTRLLSVGETETLTVSIDLTDFTSYSEKTASYILEAGDYILRVGSHSRKTEPVCVIPFSEMVVCRKVKNRLTPKEVINELKNPITTAEECSELTRLIPNLSDFETVTVPNELPKISAEPVGEYTFDDLLDGKCTPEELAACLPDDELALILTGDGEIKRMEAGVIPNKEYAVGEGSHTHPVKSLNIPVSTMQDGPAGVRASAFTNLIPPTDEINGTDCICYPSYTALAASWNRALAYEIGAAITADMERYGFNGLCAPGVNLHRDPRCGRNFEYFSEDPFLAAEMAIGIINGIEEKPTEDGLRYYAILKHFACNNCEDNRLISDSVLTERCARELYLRVFEYVIRKSSASSVMTSYNIVNGTYAAANSELLDGILRTEWGYNGWVMTDWDVYAPPVECLKGGSDTVMPGKYISFEDMQKQGLDRATAVRRAASLLRHLAKTKHFKV